MDETFFQELDSSITNLSADKCWKRAIDGIIIWFSPIDYDSQVKINQRLAETEDSAVITEVKRYALSFSIVGINEIDLRPYRYVTPSFILNGKKVSLNAYIYSKLGKWNAELVDTAFKVFSDLMETEKKNILKDVVFENEKPLLEELAELETRSAEIREQLGLPRLMEEDKESLGEPLKNTLHEEYKDDDEEDEEYSDAERREVLEDLTPLEDDKHKRKIKNEDRPVVDENFNPFAVYDAPEPVRTVPVPAPPTSSTPHKPTPTRELSIDEIENPHIYVKPNTPDNPRAALPSVDQSGVIEDRVKSVDSRPVIDTVPKTSINPRFNPPKKML